MRSSVRRTCARLRFIAVAVRTWQDHFASYGVHLPGFQAFSFSTEAATKTIIIIITTVKQASKLEHLLGSCICIGFGFWDNNLCANNLYVAISPSKTFDTLCLCMRNLCASVQNAPPQQLLCVTCRYIICAHVTSSMTALCIMAAKFMVQSLWLTTRATCKAFWIFEYD